MALGFGGKVGGTVRPSILVHLDAVQAPTPQSIAAFVAGSAEAAPLLKARSSNSSVAVKDLQAGELTAIAHKAAYTEASPDAPAIK
jgi:hypothetical protein